tara:strand:- start:3572 stop:3976 length:405 start_codon:yes stop_codon:yes gene_type:complete
MVHARRKFVELHIAGKSQIVGEAVQQIRELYEVEQKAHPLSVEERHRIRQQVPDGTAIAKALDYSLNGWTALIRYLEDGAIPIDNNWVENLIRPWALGRKNWLLAGSLRRGQRAAAIMSLIQSATLKGHEPLVI